jgi:hypothetical protein
MYAPLIGRLSQWNMGSLKPHQRIAYDVKSNWKYVIQNFNECYHCPTIHPMLNKYANYTSAENDLVEGPFLGGFLSITSGGSMTVTGRTCALPLGDLDENESQRGYYYSILSNLLLNIHPDYVMFHLVFPDSAGKQHGRQRVAFPSRCLSATRFPPAGGGRFLARDQPAGLARLRVEPAGCRIKSLHTWLVHTARKPAGGIRRALFESDEGLSLSLRARRSLSLNEAIIRSFLTSDDCFATLAMKP